MKVVKLLWCLGRVSLASWALLENHLGLGSGTVYAFDLQQL